MQFLNSPDIPYGDGKLTSTPVCRNVMDATPTQRFSATSIQTPDIKMETRYVIFPPIYTACYSTTKYSVDRL